MADKSRNGRPTAQAVTIPVPGPRPAVRATLRALAALTRRHGGRHRTA